MIRKHLITTIIITILSIRKILSSSLFYQNHKTRSLSIIIIIHCYKYNSPPWRISTKNHSKSYIIQRILSSNQNTTDKFMIVLSITSTFMIIANILPKTTPDTSLIINNSINYSLSTWIRPSYSYNLSYLTIYTTQILIYLFHNSLSKMTNHLWTLILIKTSF